MNIQIFGHRKDPETRKALRFFAERRIKPHFVDLKERAASKGELRRFVDRFGIEEVVDENSRRYDELGLGAMHWGYDRWLEILEDEPLLLKTPLSRSKHRIAIGYVPDKWTEWMEEE